jgi:glycosyltransferase involved in cell wall biosynthesis
MKSLKIAQVAPLWASIPPKEYGGAELMVHWLTEELVNLGHDVTLFASGDSRTSAQLKSVCKSNLMDMMERGEAYLYECYAAANFAEALRQDKSFDVIHCHLGASMIPFSTLSTIPVVHTVHAGLDIIDEQWVLGQYPNVPIAAISRSQVHILPPNCQNNIHVIYHGCDFDAYEISITSKNYLAFLGRMGPQKNPLGAIKIAKEVGMPIRLAGEPRNTTEKTYFIEKVKPLIDGENVVYLGPISHLKKVELLKGAGALLFPIQWDEHFGIVMIEAMACGTPVVACKRGSVAEVVDYGKTGFYAETVDELGPLVSHAMTLNRRVVREHALQRFSVRRMVDDYLVLYESLVKEHIYEK